MPMCSLLTLNHKKHLNIDIKIKSLDEFQAKSIKDRKIPHIQNTDVIKCSKGPCSKTCRFTGMSHETNSGFNVMLYNLLPFLHSTVTAQCNR
jgi:hypothetical protein